MKELSRLCIEADPVPRLLLHKHDGCQLTRHLLNGRVLLFTAPISFLRKSLDDRFIDLRMNPF